MSGRDVAWLSEACHVDQRLHGGRSRIRSYGRTPQLVAGAFSLKLFACSGPNLESDIGIFGDSSLRARLASKFGAPLDPEQDAQSAGALFELTTKLDQERARAEHLEDELGRTVRMQRMSGRRSRSSVSTLHTA